MLHNRGEVWRHFTMAAKFLDRISTIFLEGDSHFYFWTMEEKIELPFCSWMQPYTWKLFVIFFVFTAIFAGPQFVEIQNFCYDGNTTLLCWYKI